MENLFIKQITKNITIEQNINYKFFQTIIKKINKIQH